MIRDGRIQTQLGAERERVLVQRGAMRGRALTHLEAWRGHVMAQTRVGQQKGHSLILDCNFRAMNF